MKKFALLLAALIIFCVAMPCTAFAAEEKMFWVTHFNDSYAEGAGVIFTDSDESGDWWAHVAFAPVEGLENVYEIVEFANKQGTAGSFDIPEGGFVYGINVGNNWPQLIEQGGCKGDGATGLWYDTPEHMTYPNYAGINVTPMWNEALTWQVGDMFVIEGLDLDAQEVPTSTADVMWYEDAYVCTATYAAYEGEVPTESAPATSDDSAADSSEPAASDDSTADSSKTESSAPVSADSSDVAEEESGNALIWIIIAVAGVAVVAVVVVVVLKKK